MQNNLALDAATTWKASPPPVPQIESAQALTIFVGNLPTFIAVILAWMHSNGRSEFKRVEEVMDARLKHHFENN